MRNESVLVVMPLYNAASYVEKAVDSIFAQTYTGYQLLIVDDGSYDGSSEIISRYVEDKLTIMRQENGGPSVAMNLAVKYAQENRIPFIARMDADDLSLPRRLEVQLELLRKNSNAAACSSNCYYIDSETEDIVGTSTVSTRSPIIKWEIESGLRGMIQGASLFRTDALLSIGGYRTHFRYAEETDLFLRLSEKFQLVNSKEYLYKIRLNKSSLSMQNVKKNLLYHFYALECSRNRRARRPEGSFEAFLEKVDLKSSIRIRHEGLILNLWRLNIANHNYFSLLLAALIDPRRVIVRILRKL
jgi:glycosyltransferase involved in cell wall biosynthesis